MNDINDLDAAYLAGFVDGEGCIGISGSCSTDHCVRFRVTQTNQDVLVWIKTVTGVGNVYKVRSIPGRKDSWEWATTGSKAIEVIRRLYPFLKVKRLPAEVAIKFSGVMRSGHRLSDKQKSERVSLRSEMDVANRTDSRYR